MCNLLLTIFKYIKNLSYNNNFFIIITNVQTYDFPFEKKMVMSSTKHLNTTIMFIFFINQII